MLQCLVLAFYFSHSVMYPMIVPLLPKEYTNAMLTTKCHAHEISSLGRIDNITSACHFKLEELHSIFFISSVASINVYSRNKRRPTMDCKMARDHLMLGACPILASLVKRYVRRVIVLHQARIVLEISILMPALSI